MTKPRKYLHNLIPIRINRLVNYDGSFEYQFDGNTLSLVPESHGKRCFLSVFINGIRQPMKWTLSSQPHKGKLRNGAIIGYRYDEKYFVVGADGRRYAYLYLCPETCRIGTRRDFFPPHGTWNAYPRRKDDKSFREQAKAQYQELFGEKDEFMREYKKLEKRSRFGL